MVRTISLFFITLISLQFRILYSQTLEALTPMADYRSNHAGFFLPDGRLFIAGGKAGSNYLTSTEIYDPSSGLWTFGPEMSFGRSDLKALLLPDNRVLLCSGNNPASGFPSLPTGYIWNTDSTSFSFLSPSCRADYAEHFFQMPNEELLVFRGGTEQVEIQRWNFKNNTGRTCGKLAHGRYDYAAVKLNDGRFLLSGGYLGPTTYYSMPNSEIFNPFDSSSTPTGHMITDRISHKMIVLGDGRVLAIAGKRSPGQFTKSCEIYDPAKGTWSSTGPTNAVCYPDWIGLLSNGNYMLIGSGNGFDKFVESYDPILGTWAILDTIPLNRVDLPIIVSENGEIYFPGGYKGAPGWSNEVSRYTHPSLPVELSKFTLSVMGNQVLLLWETQSESNNFGFEVQEASLGVTATLSDLTRWETLGFVAGSGTTTKARSYSYFTPATSHVSYFRLKQIDLDGSTHYSNVLTLNSKVSEFNLFPNYPNPFNPETIISFDLPEKGVVRVSIFDLLGRIVAEPEYRILPAGHHSVSWKGTDQRGNLLSTGVYFCRAIFQSNGEKVVKTQSISLVR